jgi:hypothetical protein
MGEQQPALAWMAASLRARQPDTDALTLARHALHEPMDIRTLIEPS